MQGKITLAKTAGFCFGVNRAVNMLYDLISKDEKICTLGPIIHNPQVIHDLESKGVTILDDIKNASKDRKVVIRTHGVEKDVLKYCIDNSLDYIDATCPFVKKIHKIVEKNSSETMPVLIAGDKNHDNMHITGSVEINNKPINISLLVSLRFFSIFQSNDNALLLINTSNRMRYNQEKISM